MAERKANNDTTICKKCTKPLNGVSVVCEGFCLNAFHLECAKLSFDELLCYRKVPNVYWMCDNCKLEIDNIRKSGTLQTGSTSIQPIVNLDVNRHDEEIAELRHQITVIRQTLSDISSTCTSSRPGSTSAISPLAQSSPLSKPGLLLGTRNIGQSCSSVGSSAVEGEKYWLFFTRVKNTATERDITEMVTDSLEVLDAGVVAKKLVPPWKDAYSLPFISFMVGIDIRYKEKAMLQSTWPAGIYYREFRHNVWEPSLRRTSMA